jgi:predicted  nucleic acid-binding Zn-ribbon protein
MKSEDAVEIVKWSNDLESNLEGFERRIEQLKEDWDPRTIYVQERRFIKKEIEVIQKKTSKAKYEVTEVRKEVKSIKDNLRKEIKQLLSEAKEIGIPHKW